MIVGRPLAPALRWPWKSSVVKGLAELAALAGIMIVTGLRMGSKSDVSPQNLLVYQRVNKYIQSWNLHDG